MFVPCWIDYPQSHMYGTPKSLQTQFVTGNISVISRLPMIVLRMMMMMAIMLMMVTTMITTMLKVQERFSACLHNLFRQIAEFAEGRVLLKSCESAN